MNINSAFPSKYLKAADVEETELVAAIKTVKMETIGQGQKQELKPVVYFEGVEKGLVLNKTNAKMIAVIAKSQDTDEWTGVQVRLIATEVEYQGDLVMSIRVRNAKRTARPQEKAESVEAPSADDIPF